MRLSVIYRAFSVLLFVFAATGCAVFTDTDIGTRPAPVEDCTEGEMRCSTDGGRIEVCECADESCRFQQVTSCDSSQRCTQGLSSAVCADSCPGGANEQFWALDADSDNFSFEENETLSCNSPGSDYRLSSELQPALDCDDSNASVNPGAVEAPGNEVDENCDDQIACFVDSDRDGFVPVAAGRPVSATTDNDQCRLVDGFSITAGEESDCDDNDVNVNPDAEELCNGVDDDCDGAPDAGVGSDPDITDKCLATGKTGCLDATECVTDTCFKPVDANEIEDEGVCISSTPSCSEYCALYGEVKNSCDFFLPPALDDCEPNCHQPPSNDACITACEQSIAGSQTSAALTIGDYDDEADAPTIGCRSQFFVDAILADNSSDRADACSRGTLSMGGYCGTKANLGRCVPNPDFGSDRTEPQYLGPNCAFGSNCAISGQEPDDYKVCLPQCSFRAADATTPQVATCPIFPDMDPTLTVSCNLVACLGDTSSGGCIGDSSTRCTYLCGDSNSSCDGPLENDLVASQDRGLECVQWVPTAGFAAGGACFPDEDPLPKLLCTRPIFRTVGEQTIADFDLADVVELTRLGPDAVLDALEEVDSPADVVSALDVTDCFSDSSDACDDPSAIGCDDCLFQLRECLDDNCENSCSNPEPPLGNGEDNLNNGACVCCAKNNTFGDDRTCIKNFRSCSGIEADFFDSVINNDPILNTCTGLEN